jgi:hypothetical protein
MFDRPAFVNALSTPFDDWGEQVIEFLCRLSVELVGDVGVEVARFADGRVAEWPRRGDVTLRSIPADRLKVALP